MGQQATYLFHFDIWWKENQISTDTCSFSPETNNTSTELQPEFHSQDCKPMVASGIPSHNHVFLKCFFSDNA